MKKRGTTMVTGLVVAMAITAMGGSTAHATGGRHGREASQPVIVPYATDTPPDRPPVVVPFIDCVRRAPRGLREVVFGYENRSDVSVSEPLDGLSNLVTGGRSGAQARPVQFLPGRHAASFSVRYRPNDPPTWTFLSPARTDVTYPQNWSVSITPSRSWAKEPRCDADVPSRFANVQSVQTVFAPTNITRTDTATSFIDSYDVQLSPQALQVGCTDGGTGRLDGVVYGWGPTTNVGPVDDAPVSSVPRGSTTFLVTTDSDRHIESTGDPVTMSQMSNDISASCMYPGGSVVPAPVYWEDRIGEYFTIEQIMVGDGWNLAFGIVAPGGIRVR